MTPPDHGARRSPGPTGENAGAGVAGRAAGAFGAAAPLPRHGRGPQSGPGSPAGERVLPGQDPTTGINRETPFPPDEAALRRAGFVGLRVVGDVHGDLRGFAAAIGGAAAERLFVVQLGDLTDEGPDSLGVLRAARTLRESGAGLFLLGNHDHKLRRALAGDAIRMNPDGLGITLAQIRAAPDGQALAGWAIQAIARAPGWWRCGASAFVHAAWHPRMLQEPPPTNAPAGRPDPLLSRAMFGQVTGAARADGLPERQHAWVDHIPAGLTVYCGHDRRSSDGRPLVQHGAAGGTAVFLDTGAGKGGHLSWIDLRW